MICVVGERYHAVKSYKYFRSKIFPCIYFIIIIISQSIFMKFSAFKSRNEYNFVFRMMYLYYYFYLSIKFDLILQILLHNHCDVKHVHFCFNIKCLKQKFAKLYENVKIIIILSKVVKSRIWYKQLVYKSPLPQ